MFSDTLINVTNLEQDLYRSINKLRSDKTPFGLREDLYSAALKHAHDFLKKKISNLKDGFEERRNYFEDAKRYSEIAFITKPCPNDPNSTITSIIEKNFLPKIQSHINSIGPAALKLKSNKYIVVIFLAFFPPQVSIRRFLNYFPNMRTVKLPATNFEYLVYLINKFRRMIKFNDFENLPISKNDSCKRIQFNKSSFTSRRSTELFCWLFTDKKFIDLMTEMWTNFSYSTEKVESEHILNLHFYRNEEEYVYQIHLQLPKDDENDIKNNEVLERNIDFDKLVDNINHINENLSKEEYAINEPEILSKLEEHIKDNESSKEEERLKQEEEQLRQQEENIKQQVEQFQQEEQLLRQDEERLKQQEEPKQQEDQIIQQEQPNQNEEDQLKQQEEPKHQENQIIQQEQPNQNEEDQLKQQEEQIKQQEERLQQEEKQLREDEERLKQQPEQQQELNQKEEEIKQQEEELKQKAEELKQKEQQNNQSDDDLENLINELNESIENTDNNNNNNEATKESVPLAEEAKEENKGQSLEDLLNDIENDDKIGKSLSNESFDNIKDEIISQDTDKDSIPSGSQNDLNAPDNNDNVVEDDENQIPYAAIIDGDDDDADSSSTILIRHVNDDDQNDDFKPVDEYSQIVKDGNQSFSSDDENKTNDTHEDNPINSSIAKIASDILYVPENEEKAQEKVEPKKSPIKAPKIRQSHKGSPSPKSMHMKKTTSSNLKKSNPIKTVPQDFSSSDNIPTNS